MEVLGPNKETETSQQWEKEDVPITIPFGGIDWEKEKKWKWFQ